MNPVGYRLNFIPSSSYVEFLTLVPQNVSVFADKALKGMVKLK